jgi:RsiW-degrading membrane proteinase PrsW (M82 family)
MSLTRQPAYWLFLVFLVGCSLIVGGEQLSYLGSQPGAWLLSLVLLAATAIPAGIIIYRLDQFEPEPASLIAVALLWGGIVAVTFSGMANSYALGFFQHVLPAATVDSWGAAIVAPVNEEFYKGAGLVIIYLMARTEFDGLMDGLVYGAMIGLGFQVVENVQYFVHAASESGAGHLGPVVSMYFVRVVLAGLYSHTLFSGLMGFGFAYAVTQWDKSRRRRLSVAALFVALAWAAHFVWNSPWLESLMGRGGGSFVLVFLVKGVPFVVFLAVLAVVARRREGQAFARLVAAEVGSDVLNEAEFRILRSGRRRRAALRQIKRRRGRGARRMLKRLQREQMNLALFHTKVREVDHPALEAQRDTIRALKARLVASAGSTVAPSWTA